MVLLSGHFIVHLSVQNLWNWKENQNTSKVLFSKLWTLALVCCKDYHGNF